MHVSLAGIGYSRLQPDFFFSVFAAACGGERQAGISIRKSTITTRQKRNQQATAAETAKAGAH
jgi:hypothetical protein